jgi:ribonuclease Z
MVWDGPGGPLLIDAGGSTYQRLLKAGLEPRELRGIVLTHSHADHINGLTALLFSLYVVGRQEPIAVYGLEPTLAIVRRVLEAFELEQYVLPADWRPIQAGEDIPLPDVEGWRLRTAATDHPRPCIALRFEEAVSGRALTYSCDTAPCAAVTELARGSRVLIHEATTPGPFPGHTSPRQAGEVAAEAGVGRLVLVHFSPRWTMPEARAIAEVRAGGFTGRAEVGQEYQVLELAEIR